jgi:hypothetical protein
MGIGLFIMDAILEMETIRENELSVVFFRYFMNFYLGSTPIFRITIGLNSSLGLRIKFSFFQVIKSWEEKKCKKIPLYAQRIDIAISK